jgi:hypothetical protein
MCEMVGDEARKVYLKVADAGSPSGHFGTRLNQNTQVRVR